MTDNKGTTTILKLLLLQLKIVTNNLQAKGHYYTQEVVFWYFYKSNFPSCLQKSYKPFSAEHSIFKLTPVGRLVIRCSNFLLHHFSKSWAFLGPSSMKKLVNSTAKLNNAAIPIAGAPRTCKNVFTKVIFLM